MIHRCVSSSSVQCVAKDCEWQFDVRWQRLGGENGATTTCVNSKPNVFESGGMLTISCRRIIWLRLSKSTLKILLRLPEDVTSYENDMDGPLDARLRWEPVIRTQIRNDYASSSECNYRATTMGSTLFCTERHKLNMATVNHFLHTTGISSFSTL